MQSMSTETKEFPQGLRILLVDNDFTSLRMTEEMSLQCQYQVTKCSEAIVALNLLREMKGCFDLVLIDVNIPDMDGFEFVKRIQFEMNLPVIIMSSDDRTSAVMKALKNGACDYLIKPVRQEVLRNIWQHVWKRKLNENKEHENSGCFEDNDRNQYTSLPDQREVMVKLPMKRSISKEDEDGELVNDDPPASKKPRVVWSVELHQQFVSAVKELGLDKAVPKRILELMNIPGLTRENVASHLQKYRLYLKRQVSEEDHHQQNGMSNTIGYVESKLGGLGSVDIEVLAAAGQVSPQTLALQTVDQASLLHASIQRPNNFPHSIVTLDDAHSGLEAWSHSNAIGSVGPNGNLGEIGVHNKNILLNILHQQRLHQQKQQQLLLHNQSHSFNTVQPSCLLVPSQSTGTFLAGNSSVSVNHSSSYGRANAPIDSSSFFAPQSNDSSSSISRCAGGNGYRSLGTISPSTSLPSCSSQQLHNSTLTYYSARPLQSLAPNHSDTQGPYGTQSGDALEQAAIKNLGFVGKGTCIPSSFSALEIESSINDLSQGQISVDSNGNTVNEPNIDLVDNPEVGIPVLQRYSSLYHMSMFPE